MLQETKLVDSDIAQDYSEKIGSPFKDCLTGLVNHGFFHLTLEREIERCRRYGATFTMGLVGIDSFKQFNAVNGRLAGERLLKDVAGAIEKSIRKVDLAARYTGDVYSIIFAESNTADLLQAAERIRAAVNNLPGKPTASIGLVDYSAESVTTEDLFLKAEDALNKSKLRGKNRVSVFEHAEAPAQTQSPKVLVVDDDPKNLKLMQAMLIPLKYELFTAESGRGALDIMSKMDIDLVLLDVMMPEMDGFEVCRRIKKNPNTKMIPVVLVTALDDLDSRIKGIEAGADDFLSKPASRPELIARTKSLIKLKLMNNSLTSIENVLFSLARAVEAKDTYTQGHTERVASLSMALGKRLELPPQDMTALSFGGVMHDIGKIGVPMSILNKPGKLNEEEWDIMKKHSTIGYNIGLPLEKNLGAALQVIQHHHEKMDGSGYPDGLKGEDIPVVARIVGIADIFDALTTDRPYREGMSTERAIEILIEESDMGKLDKKIVAELIDYLGGLPSTVLVKAQE